MTMKNTILTLIVFLTGCSFNASFSTKPSAPIQQETCRYTPPQLPDIPPVPIDKISKLGPHAKSEVKQALLDHIKESHDYMTEVAKLHREAYLRYTRCN